MPESEDPKNDLRNSQFGGGFINADTVNAQRIGGDIWNFFLGQPTLRPIGNPLRSESQRLLLAEVKHEVTARLKQSLHNAVLINLRKELQSQKVKRTWDAEIKIGSKPPEPLPDTTTILEVFDSEEIAGRLLILGNPGAGKTTTMLELARDLIARAEKKSNYPVPILLNLSSWKNYHQSITEWLVTELNSKYGVSIKFGKEWLENRQFIPMLDGLDELEPTRQKPCIQAINRFIQGEQHPQYLIICSRNEEYVRHNTNLQLNAAICLRPLTDLQIQNYLSDIKQIDFWQIIVDSPSLIKVSRIPLILNVIILTYEKMSLEDWKRFNSTTDLLTYLLDAYIQTMLAGSTNASLYTKQKLPSVNQTRRLLAWLALQLQRESQIEFSIENMQPFKLLNNPKKIAYRAIYYSIVILIAGIIIHLSSGSVFGKIGVLKGFIIVSLGYKIIDEIHLKKFLLWSWLEAKNGLILGAIIGLNFGVMIGYSLSLGKIFATLFYGIAGTLFLGIIGALIAGLISTLSGKSIEDVYKEEYSNQGIWRSLFNSGIAGILNGLIGGLIGWFIGWLIYQKLHLDLFDGLMFGLMFGLMSGLMFGGGIACIKHFSLRLILWKNGYIPWNYTRFLDYCTERLFLQRVGGRYSFIHKMLQDHFAQMPLERVDPKSEWSKHGE